MAENWDVSPWFVATVLGPVILGAVIAVVLSRRGAGRGGDRRVDRPVRPGAAGPAPVRSLWGLGGRGWAWSRWSGVILALVLAAGAAVYVAAS